ncbi:MAG: ribbon-helix-helix domain-containing protein [Candidatus Thermoplasmatota archaeon]
MQVLEEKKMIPVRLPEDIVERLDRIVHRFGYSSRSDLIREALEHYTKEVEAGKIIRLRNISKMQAKKEIREYLKRREKAWLDEIADDLKIDFSLVVELIEELEKEKLVAEV